jgi:uncharacterized protein (UPF0335 family)
MEGPIAGRHDSARRKTPRRAQFAFGAAARRASLPDDQALEPGAQPESMEFQLAEGSIAADELRLLIERIERLEEEKKAMADDIRDVYAEARARGYDPKTMRTVVRLRKMENHVRQEAEALLDTYKAALGLA